MNLEKHYSESFYNAQSSGSFQSAQEVLPYVFDLVKPKSIIDFGCGKGTWLKVAFDLGIKEAVGIEGHWVKDEDIQDQRITLITKNLEEHIILDKKFDLAISLEVGEHLSKERSESFVADITKAANIVMFSAAIPGQGGENHINEQSASFWIKQFEKQSFRVIDCIRAKFWTNEKVGPAYRQNAFIFTKIGTKIEIPGDYLLPYTMIDIVHPIVHDWSVRRKPGIKGTVIAMLRLPWLIFHKIILKRKYK